MVTVLRSAVMTVMALIYPYFIYQSLTQGTTWMAPAIIISFYTYQALKTQDHQKRFIKLALVLLLLVGLFYFDILTAKLMPIIVQFMLLHFFGKTLLKHHGPPLIERFVRLEFIEIPAEITLYCRKLTFMWSFFFAFNIIVCLLLAFYAPVSWWAIYTGLGMLLGTGILIIGEYVFRPFFFPNLVIPDMKSSVKHMMIHGRKLWQEHE